MTEPVPGQTPEPVAAEQQPTPPPTDATSGTTTGTTTGAGTAGADPTAPAADVPPADPQELFGSLSLAAIEADIDRLMNDKMSRLDGMLAGLEELVQKLEGEITQLEPPTEGTTP